MSGRFITRMQVVKCDGRRERVSFDKILTRIESICDKLDLDRIDTFQVTKETIQGLRDGITTAEIDQYSSIKCAEKIQDDPQYDRLAAGLSISRLHKMTPSTFREATEKLFNNLDHQGNHNPLVTHQYHDFVMKHIDAIEAALDYERDYSFDFFGIKTLERSYLMKVNIDCGNKKILERPQHMFMRVSLAIHLDDIDAALETYDYMSRKYFTHASPTLYNAGTKTPQLSSCFLFQSEDSLHGIFNTISDAAQVSKYAGGIGIAINNIRANGSQIRSTNGTSDGIIPMIRVLNSVGRYVNQSGRRNGAIAVYVEPWHADIYEFCDLRKNLGDEEQRARDTFIALWIPDLFMKRVKAEDYWSLMCPNECPNLTTTYGDEFEKLYTQYEAEGRYKRRVKAEDLWYHILSSQLETGMPYMLYKDNVNRQSNQQNLGTIQCSNLCVSGDTYVMTRKGQFPIATLLGQYIDVWNGREWSNVLICQTGINQELVRVQLSNGSHLDCTLHHRFFLEDGREVQTKHLSVGDILLDYHLPDHIDPADEVTSDDVLPLNDTSDAIIAWFSQYVDNNATYDIDNMSFHALDEDKSFLLRIRLMLHNIGVDSEIRSVNDKWQLYIDHVSTYALYEKGLHSRHFTELPTIIPSQRHRVFVTNIQTLENHGTTYCFTEPIRHMGMFNGILTGQCSEIVEYTSPSETAVCNLNSICLPRFINDDGTIDYETLCYVAQICTRNLNKIIDINFYPTESTKRSNLMHRPIGVGVQGLADVYYKLGIPFDSDEARDINKRLFETIYYGCLKASMELAKQHGPYSSFDGSPFSKGILQYHMWGLTEDDLLMNFDWPTLIGDIKKYGTRNSLLTALMPTASTSQIMGNAESFEPRTTNIYTRTTLAGEFVIVNRYLIENLISLGIWNKEIRDELVFDNGSIANITEVPTHIKEVFKTGFEMKTKPILQQAVERGPFIDQSQSMNIFSRNPDFHMLTSSHFFGWSNRIKTGMYYLRTQPAVNPIKFGLDALTIRRINKKRAQSVAADNTSNVSDEDDDNTVLSQNGHYIPEPKECEMCSG